MPAGGRRIQDAGSFRHAIWDLRCELFDTYCRMQEAGEEYTMHGI